MLRISLYILFMIKIKFGNKARKWFFQKNKELFFSQTELRSHVMVIPGSSKTIGCDVFLASVARQVIDIGGTVLVIDGTDDFESSVNFYKHLLRVCRDSNFLTKPEDDQIIFEAVSGINAANYSSKLIFVPVTDARGEEVFSALGKGAERFFEENINTQNGRGNPLVIFLRKPRAGRSLGAFPAMLRSMGASIFFYSEFGEQLDVEVRANAMLEVHIDDLFELKKDPFKGRVIARNCWKDDECTEFLFSEKP